METDSMYNTDMLFERITTLQMDISICEDTIKKYVPIYDEHLRKIDPVLHKRIESTIIDRKINSPEDSITNHDCDKIDMTEDVSDSLRKQLYYGMMKIIHPDKNGGKQHIYHTKIIKAYENNDLGQLMWFSKKIGCELDIDLDDYIDEIREKYSTLIIKLDKLKGMAIWEYIKTGIRHRDTIIKSHIFSLNIEYPPPKSVKIQENIDMYKKLQLEDKDKIHDEYYLKKITELEVELNAELEKDNQKLREENEKIKQRIEELKLLA